MTLKTIKNTPPPPLLHPQLSIAQRLISTIMTAMTNIMARDGDQTFPVTHDDVFTLSDYPKTSFLKSAYRVKMVDPGSFDTTMPLHQFREFPDHG